MDTECRFDDRVAIITGGGGGLGRAYARLLASRGACLVINDVAASEAGGQSPAANLCAEINGLGGTAVPYDGSIAEPRTATALVETAQQAFGQVDIIVNNAGVVRDRSFLKMTQDEIDEVLAVHLHGSMSLTKAAWPILRERRYGRVVMTTSVAGLFGNIGQANYAAAKAGLVGLGRTLAREGAKYDILVNLISPGAATAMTSAVVPERLHAQMSPHRVAPMVGYLCHESCAFTGEIFFAASGRFAQNLIIETAGFECPDATIEDIAAHIAEITDTTSWTVPQDAMILPD